MSTPSAFVDQVSADFLAYWEALAPIAWENVTFDPTEYPTGYVTFTVQHIAATPRGVATNVTRAAGRIVITAYTPEDCGADAAYALAESALTFLATWEPVAETRKLRNVALQEQGQQSGWSAVETSAEFAYDSA